MIKQVFSTASTLIIFFILLFAYTKFVGPIPFQINSTSTTKSTTFDVTGEGKALIKPDFAIVSAGVSANGLTTKEAQDKINQTINKVSEGIKTLGVDPKDIQTANYNINPTYDYQTGSQKITGYSGNTNLTIKVRNIDNVGKIIDSATLNGANNVSNLGFDTADKSVVENEARVKAVAVAKKKAEDASKITGFKLGKIINYSENFGGYPTIRPLMVGASVDKANSPETNLEPGSNEVRVNVTLSFEIR